MTGQGPARKRVAFQGELGSYSDEAASRFFGEDFEPLPQRTLAAVFNAVESHRADAGVVPVENSIEGSVGEAYDLLLSTGLRVVGEVYVRVVHCLVGLQESDLSTVRRVYSHPQALGQCRAWISVMGYEPIGFYDTAGAARFVKESGDPTCAAIASERAARIYGLRVLARGIEDYGRNYTRFLVIGRDPPQPSKRTKTTVIFSVAHRPGSLYRALGPLAERGINLTKIESRPTRARPWQYHFFVDFEGSVEEDRVREALSELSNHTLFLKVLGSYPMAQIEEVD
ncbi:MAG: prephenate dehydratase [Nitrososphaerota archaeon]|nr:prephenate dehydratase [Nitrososphaerota archaeon]